MNKSTMDIKHISFDKPENKFGESVVWVDHSGEMPLPGPEGDGELAKLLINVGVDGAYTIVHQQGGYVPELRKVIEDLMFLVERLEAIHPADESIGRCLEFGNWGRCRDYYGHPEGEAGEHDFPTEEQWRRTHR